MSGWIKLEKDLETDPRVRRMARQISVTDVTHERINFANAVTQVIGALARLWIFADTHAREDDSIDVAPNELDELLGVPGFCALMPNDWLRDRGDGTMELPGFQEHNGVEAKKRALTQKRVALHRKRSGVTGGNASSLPDQDQTKTKTKTKTTKKRARATSGMGITYPIGLDAPAWQRWLDYRKASGKALKPASLQAAVDELAKFGADQSAVVQQSIAHGWQGLFPLKTSGAGGKPQQKFVAPPDDPEAANA